MACYGDYADKYSDVIADKKAAIIGEARAKYGITPNDIQNDLTAGQNRPDWIFSCYAPARNAPAQLIEGPDREQSFEEMRLYHYMAAASENPEAAVHEVSQRAGELYHTIEQQMQSILVDIDNAIKYIVDAENKHPNRIDLIDGVKPNDAQQSQPSQSQQGQLGASGAPQSSFGQPALGKPAFGQPSQYAAPFGQPQPQGSSFGQPSAFGQPSTLGQNPQSTFGHPAFGQPGFGQPSQPTAPFGQPSQPTAAFGQPQPQGSSFGQPSAFGQQSTLGQPSGFGQLAANSQSGFGQSGLSQSNVPFGQGNSQPSPFGQLAGHSQQEGQSTGGGFRPPEFGQPAQRAPGFGNRVGPSGWDNLDEDGHMSIDGRPRGIGGQSASTGLKKPKQGPMRIPRISGETIRDPATGEYKLYKGQPVTRSRHGNPIYPHPDHPGRYVKIMFPNGPPAPESLRDIANDDSEYTDEIRAAYEYAATHDEWKDGIMPIVAPKPEWINFDF